MTSLILRTYPWSCSPQRSPGRGVRHSGFHRRIAFQVVFMALALLTGSLACAQQEGKPKLPVIDKIGSGISHQAFSGIVESLDTKHNLLNVNAVEGGTSETFPIKKNTHVTTVGGALRKVSDLVPGSDVIVYFDERAEHRSVTRIEILPQESKKQAPPS